MLYAGIDVGGEKKGQALCLLDLQCVVRRLEYGLTVSEVLNVLHEEKRQLCCIGIDAPRQPVKNEAAKAGRFCERELVHATGLRVQWSPRKNDLNKQHNLWMVQGIALFERIAAELPHIRTLEVFPSASYGRFPPDAAIKVPLALFERKSRMDQLDAACCALVAWCYDKGLVRHFGAGDPEGEIIVPVYSEPASKDSVCKDSGCEKK